MRRCLSKQECRQLLHMAHELQLEAQLDMKQELGKTQKRLKKEIFKEVDQILSDYMKTEEYKHLLVESIEKAAEFAKGASMTIYINPTDPDKKEFLELYIQFKENLTSKAKKEL